MVSVSIPEKIDLDKLMEKFPITDPKLLKCKDLKEKIAWVLSDLPFISYRLLPWDWKGDTSSRVLQKYVREYASILKHLKNAEIIVSTGYMPGSYCRSYYIKKKFGMRMKPYPITNFPLVKKIRAFEVEVQKAQHEKHLDEWDDSYLIRWFNKNLEIEQAAALMYLGGQYTDTLSAKKRIGKRRETLEDNWDRIVSIRSIERLMKHIYIFSRDERGRFYSNIVNMDRELRPYLRYRGTSLAYLDVKNCLPFLFSRVLQPDFWRQDEASYDGLLTYGMLYRKPENLIPRPELPYSLQEMSDRVATAASGPDILEYIDLVTSGMIYDDLQVNAGYRSRDAAKNAFMVMLNTEDTGRYASSHFLPKLVFSKRFPNVYEVQHLLKIVNYKHLSYLLMRIESYCMIDVICRRISHEKPRLAFYTIHDGVLTPRGNETFVLKVIKEEMNKLIGYTPRITETLW
ncbi:MAG TPA: hypothetical protein PK711_10190 [Bacteroidales bacterium]|nr:hypothetical protein [Bacteroidales bacterium]